MKDSMNLSEVSINKALKEGHITAQEARQMMMVYLKKVDYSAMRHPVSSVQRSIRTGHY